MFRLSRKRKTSGFTLIEVVIASGILAIGFIGAVGSIIITTRGAMNNTMRSVALFSAEQSIEQLRSIGKDTLLTSMTLVNSVWEFDPVADSTIPSTLVIHSTYVDDGAGGLILDTSLDRSITQQCVVLAADNGGVADTTFVTVNLDIQWTLNGRIFTDSLQTIIE